MTSRWRWSCGILSIVAVAAAGFWILKPTPRPAPTPGTTAAIDTARLNAAALVQPTTAAEVTNLGASLERSVIDAATRLPPDRALSQAQALDLAKLARVRVELLLNPDFERYRSHVIELTGRDPRGAKAPGVVSTPEDWSARTSEYRFAPVDVESVEVRCMWLRGKEQFDVFGGHTTSIPDSGKFYSSLGLMPKGSGRDVYVVSLPMEIGDIETGEPIRVFYMLTCTWCPDRHRWVPWKVGFNDVSDQFPLLPPWI